jgi:flagellin
MALSIQTNYTSMLTQDKLASSNKALGIAMQRLSTGFRINSAADDAAGLQIATRLQAQVGGQATAIRNAQDAISMLQTGEGALNEFTNIVLRMKDLATQAANGTNSTTDGSALDAEYQQLAGELNNIMKNTSYGSGTTLLADGTGKFDAAVTFQIGSSTAETLAVDVSTEIGAINTAITSTTVPGPPPVTTSPLGAIDTQGGATTAMTALDGLLDKVGTARASFGAYMNRLDHTVNNLTNMKENTAAAKGRITDADYAEEASNMTKQQLLMQTGMSVLSNSNQIGSLVTSLLR